MSEIQIELAPADANQRILSGKVPGQEQRELLGLDKIDVSEDTVVVRIPVKVVTSSFCLGMFGHSVLKLGLDGFLRKYHFEASPTVIETIRENAEYVAFGKTALDV